MPNGNMGNIYLYIAIGNGQLKSLGNIGNMGGIDNIFYLLEM